MVTGHSNQYLAGVAVQPLGGAEVVHGNSTRPSHLHLVLDHRHSVERLLMQSGGGQQG